MEFLTMDQEQGSVIGVSKCPVVQKMFISALLLTGSEAGAERSILEAISTMASGELSCKALMAAILETAVTPQQELHGETSGTRDLYICSLPVELRRVLLLPDDLRRCFVLKLLIGLSLNECSRLLSLKDCEVEQNTVWAALALAACCSRRSIAAINCDRHPFRCCK